MPDDMLLDSDVNRLLKLLCSVDVEVWSASSYVNNIEVVTRSLPRVYKPSFE